MRSTTKFRETRSRFNLDDSCLNETRHDVRLIHPPRSEARSRGRHSIDEVRHRTESGHQLPVIDSMSRGRDSGGASAMRPHWPRDVAFLLQTSPRQGDAVRKFHAVEFTAKCDSQSGLGPTTVQVWIQ